MKYRVIGSLEFDLEVDAESEEDAFIVASDTAIEGGGDWDYSVEELGEVEE